MMERFITSGASGVIPDGQERVDARLAPRRRVADTVATRRPVLQQQRSSVGDRNEEDVWELTPGSRRAGTAGKTSRSSPLGSPKKRRIEKVLRRDGALPGTGISLLSSYSFGFLGLSSSVYCRRGLRTTRLDGLCASIGGAAGFASPFFVSRSLPMRHADYQLGPAPRTGSRRSVPPTSPTRPRQLRHLPGPCSPQASSLCRRVRCVDARMRVEAAAGVPRVAKTMRRSSFSGYVRGRQASPALSTWWLAVGVTGGQSESP